MGTVLVSLDGSAHDRETVRLGTTLARILGASIELLQPLEPRRAADAAFAQRAADQSLALRAAQIDQRIDVVQRTYSGRLADHLVARANGVEDAFAVLSAGEPAPSRRLAESVAGEVIRRAHAVVVVLPRRGFVPSRSIKRLLVPLDESLLAESVLPIAMTFAREEGAEIRLLWVENVGQIMRRYGNSIDPVTDLGEITADIVALVDNTGKAYLQHAASWLRRQGIAASWSVVAGRPSTEINRRAWVEGVDLILMATHGRSRMGRLALGSVTQEVLREAVVPVLVLPPWVRQSTQQPREPVALSVV